MLNKDQIKQRREKIIQWLASDDMKSSRRDHLNGGGFTVNVRTRVEMGEKVLPITEYLRKEGIDDGMEIGEFRVQYNPATDQYVESYAFFLRGSVKGLPAFGANGNRQQDILNWLRSDDMKSDVRIFRNNRDFSVNERVRVVTDNGSLPITQWLKSEGFVDGAVVGGYRIRVNDATERFPENISFFMDGPVISVPAF